MFPRRALEARIPRGVDNPFAVAIERGEFYVELYRPEGEDRQAPHERDECCFVVEGSATFVLGEEHFRFSAGDCIFVPAGVVHRFEDFGAHLLTWVVFYGPRGGDRAGEGGSVTRGTTSAAARTRCPRPTPVLQPPPLMRAEPQPPERWRLANATPKTKPR